ncbi:MAG: DUF4145 domain-containing protein [Anaerolineae bacterium]|nr:DUF4145 domain-containing protein [Anaerolineae bacterium]
MGTIVLMSNFAFLKTSAWKPIYEDAARAEQYVLADPRSALFYGRRTVEVMVEWLYAVDREFRRPYDDNLAALMTDATFKRQVPSGVQDKMHAIRKLGNDAVHNGRAIRPDEAVAMVKMLFHIAHWFGRTYTGGRPQRHPRPIPGKTAATAAAPGRAAHPRPTQRTGRLVPQTGRRAAPGKRNRRRPQS